MTLLLAVFLFASGFVTIGYAVACQFLARRHEDLAAREAELEEELLRAKASREDYERVAAELRNHLALEREPRLAFDLRTKRRVGIA